jgi:hypothetical protein
MIKTLFLGSEWQRLKGFDFLILNLDLSVPFNLHFKSISDFILLKLNDTELLILMTELFFF